jgi:histidine triad (HIT) family protein
MQDSIFTKIINGKIPCHKIYEDDKTFVFLDINPVLPGHCLVVPKTQVEFVWDLEDSDYVALMGTSKKIAKHLRAASGEKFVSQRIIGVDVPHAHVHLIPFSDVNDLKHSPEEGAEPDHKKLGLSADKFKIS